MPYRRKHRKNKSRSNKSKSAAKKQNASQPKHGTQQKAQATASQQSLVPQKTHTAHAPPFAGASDENGHNEKTPGPAHDLHAMNTDKRLAAECHMAPRFSDFPYWQNKLLDGDDSEPTGMFRSRCQEMLEEILAENPSLVQLLADVAASISEEPSTSNATKIQEFWAALQREAEQRKGLTGPIAVPQRPPIESNSSPKKSRSDAAADEGELNVEQSSDRIMIRLKVTDPRFLKYITPSATTTTTTAKISTTTMTVGSDGVAGPMPSDGTVTDCEGAAALPDLCVQQAATLDGSRFSRWLRHCERDDTAGLTALKYALDLEEANLTALEAALDNEDADLSALLQALNCGPPTDADDCDEHRGTPGI